MVFININMNHTIILLSTITSLFISRLIIKKLLKPNIKLNQNIIITGSTKGIGFALAVEFLRRGHNVIICSRSNENIQSAISILNNYKLNGKLITGIQVDVTNYKSLENLINIAKEQFNEKTGNKNIDIFINNAGISQSPLEPLIDTDYSKIYNIINTNLIGSLYSAKLLIKTMSQQSTGGHFFFMDGAGSNGMITANYASYGASKAGIPQILKTLVKETKNTNVGIHCVSPGMVVTDLLVKSDSIGDKPKPYKIFNILSEKPSTTANWLTSKILYSAIPGNTGSYNKYLTPFGAILRFIFFWNRKTLVNEQTGEVLFDQYDLSDRVEKIE